MEVRNVRSCGWRKTGVVRKKRLKKKWEPTTPGPRFEPGPTQLSKAEQRTSTSSPSTGTPVCPCARGIVTTCLLLCLGFRTLCTLGLSCRETSSTEDGVAGLIDNGSTVNKSSLACVASSVEDRRLNDWAGRQMPSRTGASNASATWTSSGMARVDSDWKMRRHFIRGWTTPLFQKRNKPTTSLQKPFTDMQILHVTCNLFLTGCTKTYHIFLD